MPSACLPQSRSQCRERSLFAEPDYYADSMIPHAANLQDYEGQSVTNAAIGGRLTLKLTQTVDDTAQTGAHIGITEA